MKPLYNSKLKWPNINLEFYKQIVWTLKKFKFFHFFKRKFIKKIIKHVFFYYNDGVKSCLKLPTPASTGNSRVWQVASYYRAVSLYDAWTNFVEHQNLSENKNFYKILYLIKSHVNNNLAPLQNFITHRVQFHRPCVP